MKNVMWVDLGLIGHKSTRLSEIFRGEFLVEVPICNGDLGFGELPSDKFVVFMDYTLGVSGSMGTKVCTNAFETPCLFYKELNQKLINEYVEVNQPLDFKQDF